MFRHLQLGFKGTGDPVGTVTARFYVTNHLGAVRVEMDALGNVLTTNDYEPYGVALPPRVDTESRLKFTGQERDSFTNYDYMHFRFYSSSMGRFLKPDNIIPDLTNPQNWNAYTYVKGNPVNFNDPTGHLTIKGLGISDIEALDLYIEAVEYLKSSKVAKDIITNMEMLSGSDEVTVIVMVHYSGSRYLPNDNTIYWNPYEGTDISQTDTVFDKNGSLIQSPALGLLHEAGHTVEDAKNPEEYAKGVKETDKKYDPKEEKRNIEKVETPAAIQLNEPIRKSHEGKPVLVEGPTSKTVKEAPPVENQVETKTNIK